MKKILIFLVLSLIFNSGAYGNPKFFKQKVGSFISPLNKNMTKINIKPEFIGTLVTFGIPRYYFLNDLDKLSDEFNKFNIVTVRLHDNFYISLKNLQNSENVTKEFLYKLKAENKYTYNNLFECEVRRKATMISIEKKYFNDGYRTSLTRGKLLSSTTVVNLYYRKENDKYPNVMNYLITSECVKTYESPIFTINDDRNNSNLISKFFKKKDENYIFYLEIKSVLGGEILKELYDRYLDGKLTEVSLKGM